MRDWLSNHPDAVRQPEGMSTALRDLLESFTEDELNIERQIGELEALIEKSDPKVLLEKLYIAMVFSAHVSSIDVPDDGIGIGPSLIEYVIGKIISHDQYGKKNTSYKDLTRAAAEIRQAYLMSDITSVDTESMSDKEIENLYLSSSLKQRELGSSRFLYAKQVPEAARRAYRPHDKYLEDAVGFSIDQAIETTDDLCQMQSAIFNDFLQPRIKFDIAEVVSGEDFIESQRSVFEETGEIDKPLNWTKLSRDSEIVDRAYKEMGQHRQAFWLTRDFMLDQISDKHNSEVFDSYLSRMAYDLSESRDFVHVGDVNPFFRSPIIKSGSRYITPHLHALRHSMYNTFYYDLLKLDGYGDPSGSSGGPFGDKWGDYIEEWAYDSLKMTFDPSEIFLNPYYKSDNGSWEEAADIIVLHKQYLLVFECKSKKLVLSSRGGSQASAIDDLDKGIGEATRQAISFISTLEERGRVEIRTDTQQTTIVESDTKFKYPIVVLGEQYDMIGNDLFDSALELSRTPWVVSTYDLQIICDLLHPMAFIGYVSQRPRVTKNEMIRALDEIDILGWWLNNDKRFPELPENSFMMIMDYSREVARQLNFKYGP